MNHNSIINDAVEYFISDKGTMQCPEDEIEVDSSIQSIDGLRKNFTLIQKIMNMQGPQGQPISGAATMFPSPHTLAAPLHTGVAKQASANPILLNKPSLDVA